MASREGQGMQIAVILFALVTVVLAITTYIFYAEANKNAEMLKQAQDTAAQNQKGQSLANYRLTAIMYTMGLKTAPDVAAAKAAAGGAEDDEVNKLISQFKGDMQIVGDDPNEPKESYISMVNKLLTTINSKNVSVSQSNASLEATLAQKKQEVDDLTAAKKKAEDDLQAAITAYNAARQALQDQLAQATKEKDDLKSQFEEDKKALDASVADLNNQLAQVNKQLLDVQSSFSNTREQLEQIRAEQGANFDNADGLVIWVNQRQRLAWINLGSEDGLMRQMTFSVFSQQQASAFKLQERAKLDGSGTERVAKLDAKGRIEVVRIMGPHEAECRILEDFASNPILPGDWIQTPAWSPGQHLGFALGGKMDVDGDGQDDTELVKNLIRLNGGTIDAELRSDGSIDGAITATTRYFVEGKLSTDPRDADKNFLDGLKRLNDQRKDHGVEKLSVAELLERMGWKPEEKTIGLRGRSDVGASQFRKRTPAGSEPADATPAGTAPMPMPAAPATPAAPTTPADPFGSM